MTDYTENAMLFSCEGESLVGVISKPASEAVAEVGVLVVVGGPQYRVGSHRQFVLLARALATGGIACMRFDYRGMGDAEGTPRSFEAVNADIASAVDAFLAREPDVKRIVLWGLCDGASASALYAAKDARVAGLVMLNPWVRTEATEARTYLKHYYLSRLLSGAFWQKLFSGKVEVLQSFASLGNKVRHAMCADSGGASGGAFDPASTPNESLPARMLKAVARCKCPTVVLLSARDYVAREFEDAMAGESAYHDMQADKRLALIRCEEANHTFSSAIMRNRVETETLRVVRLLVEDYPTKA